MSATLAAPRPIPALLLAALGLGALVVLAVGVGSSFVPPGRVLAALAGRGEPTDALIVWTLRMPRVALAALAGAALALAGLLTQRALGNGLAAPSTLGIVDGAALGAVGFLHAFSDGQNLLTVSAGWQPLAAATGAAVLAALAWGLARRDGGTLRLILYGIALGALAKAAVTMLVVVGPVHLASQALIWLAGSVHHARWADAGVVAAGLALALPLAVGLRRAMAQMALDDESAAATGLAVERTRAALLALAVALTALAVAHAGAIGFVGLIAPHAAAMAFGRRAALTGTLLVGAGLVVAADLLARVAASPLEIPTGSVTAAVGAPFFLWLLARRGTAHA